MNLQTDQISELCHELTLTQAACEWPALAQRAADQSDTFAQFLHKVLTSEMDARQERKRQTLLSLALHRYLQLKH
jgi:DNA replication protein DnaC